jgi:hypothetical protein
MSKQLLRFILALCVVGCETAPEVTLASYCEETGHAFCARVTACGLSAPTCLADFAAGCCPGGICPGTVSTEQTDTCVSALATEACGDVQAGLTPAKCRP